MEPLEFKLLISRVVRTAQDSGLTNSDISIELLEQVKFLCCEKSVSLMEKHEHNRSHESASKG